MEDKHRQALRRHWSELRKDLEPKRLLPHMVSVLDVADEQEIISRDMREEQVDVMLEMLPRRGPNAFHCFVKALGLTQHFLAVPFKREEGGFCFGLPKNSVYKAECSFTSVEG